MTDLTELAFVAIPIALAAALVWATAVAWPRTGAPARAGKRAATLVALAAAIWMAATWIAASRGVLLDFDTRPPPFALLVAAIFLLAGGLAFSPLGARLARGIPLWVLVGVQGFRFPLEVAMHRLSERGIMPEQMSYSGQNWDIVTGITAIVVALIVKTGRGGRRLVLAWNVVGLALLVNIVVVAILSTPRFAVFGPDRLNVFVMTTPFVWLPAVMVLAALAGHLIVFRSTATSLGPSSRP